MRSTEAAKLQVQVEWMHRARHLADVVRIENECFDHPLKESDFLDELKRKIVIGNVAMVNDRVAGYMFFELHNSLLHLQNFAVATEFRRRGIGAAMISRLRRKLDVGRRDLILLETRETNLAAQLFFRSQGFKATRVLHGFYSHCQCGCGGSAEDAYMMELSITPPKHAGTNRISNLAERLWGKND